MRHHYWEWPIASYLFLGGLGGGIYFLAMVFTFNVLPSYEEVGWVFAWPGFIGLLCLGFGCFLLVFELGQPGVFYRCFIKSTSIICWGARLLSVCLIFGFFWFLSYLPLGGFAEFMAFFRPFNLVLAGVSGLGIMLYTGLMFSTLKSHAFWATPALPVLFTVSALSTACAAVTLSIGWWPAHGTINELVVASYIGEVLHMVDIILVIAEIIILLLYVLSLVGAGNVTAKKVADRWVKGKTAPIFWGLMVGCGLVLPLIMYIVGAGTAAATLIAPWIVLLSGLLLRFLFVYSDDRRAIPGEEHYYSKLPKGDEAFMTRWEYGKNEF